MEKRLPQRAVCEEVRESQKFCLPMLCVFVGVRITKARLAVENMQMFSETLSTAFRQMINVIALVSVGN